MGTIQKLHISLEIITETIAVLFQNSKKGL